MPTKYVTLLQVLSRTEFRSHYVSGVNRSFHTSLMNKMHQSVVQGKKFQGEGRNFLSVSNKEHDFTRVSWKEFSHGDAHRPYNPHRNYQVTTWVNDGCHHPIRSLELPTFAPQEKSQNQKLCQISLVFFPVVQMLSLGRQIAYRTAEPRRGWFFNPFLFFVLQRRR